MPCFRTRLIAAAIAVALTATGCATDTPETTTTLASPLATLVLGEDGLGDILVGFPPEVVTQDISALYGSPDHDSGWIVAEPNIYGTCPGQAMRAVGWGSLVVIFVNETQDPLGERFYTYTYGYDYAENVGGVDPRGLGLATEAGVGIGSTVAELESAYVDRVTITGDSTLDVWSFELEGSFLRGLLTGRDSTDTVTLIELTPGC
jgi:hypothetical protein